MSSISTMCRRPDSGPTIWIRFKTMAATERSCLPLTCEDQRIYDTVSEHKAIIDEPVAPPIVSTEPLTEQSGRWCGGDPTLPYSMAGHAAVGAGAIVGCLTRYGVGMLFGVDALSVTASTSSITAEGIIFNDLPANMMGSFCMGWVSSPPSSVMFFFFFSGCSF